MLLIFFQMADWIPFVSQTKSLLQFVCNDSEGAKKTQINFSKQCPFVSQARSLVEVIIDGQEAATETQLEFVHTTLYGVVDSFPIAGHLKGIVHYVAGDNEGGNNAMKAASRSTGTFVGSAVGMLLGGPPGAIAGGIAGGTLTDGITTGVESAIHWEYKPNGIVREVTEVVEHPTDVGKWFDTTFTVVGDGLAGYMFGKGFKNAKEAVELRNFECQKNALTEQVGQSAAGDLIEAADRMQITREKYAVPENRPHITSVVRDMNTDMLYEGHNEKIRGHCSSNRARRAKTNSNASVMSDYSVDQNTSTYLERKVPGAEPPLDRRARTCAEHRACHKFYKECPDADPQNTRISTVRYAGNGKITAVKRCQNCMAFAEGMGEAPGDLVDNQLVPCYPGIDGKTSPHAAGKGVLCTSCGFINHDKQQFERE